MLWLTKRVIFGKLKNKEIEKLKDLNFSEVFILGLLALTTIGFGFYPEILLDSTDVSINNLINNYQIEINNKMVLNK